MTHGLYSPRDFGAAADGATDDTTPIQTALDHAAANGGSLVLDARTYAVHALALRAGVTALVGPGTLRGLSDVPILSLAGTPDQPLDSVRIANLSIEAGPSLTAIDARYATQTRIEACRISGLRNFARGIRLDAGCAGSAISGCHVAGSRDPLLQSLVLIAVQATLPDPYAGYFTEPLGSVKCPPPDTRDTVIENNEIEGGTHGIAVGGASHTVIRNNTISHNQHRNINLCPAACHNTVTANRLLEAGSSAVAMAYGSNDNVVMDNEMVSHATHGGYDRDAVHSYVACLRNTIRDNRISGDFRYGVYLAVASVGTLVQNNLIRLESKPDIPDDFQVGVALENDWPPRPLPETARYSRQNWGAIRDLPWAFADTTENVIRGNQVSHCTCGFYVTQLGSLRAVRANRWEDNIVTDCRYGLYATGEARALFRDNLCRGLRLERCAEAMRLPPWPASPFTVNPATV